MNCVKCGVSVFKSPLKRVNSIGEDAIWWCEPCLRVYEPELYRNLKEDETNVEKTLKSFNYSKIRKDNMPCLKGISCNLCQSNDKAGFKRCLEKSLNS